MDLSKALGALEGSPDDFELWQTAIEAAENQDGLISKVSSAESLDAFRTTYDRFLSNFPMLQGFWARYAEWEFRLENNGKAEYLYEQALNLMPGCVDLWTRYCEFKGTITQDPEPVRLLYDRAASHIGAHFLSHLFWDSYVAFEEKVSSTERVFGVLDRAIRQPIHQYAKFFERHQEEARKLPPAKTAPEWKVTQFKAEYELDREEEAVNKHISEDYDLRVRIKYYHEQIYEATQDEVYRIWQYEQDIKRHHFDVKYIEESQLVNWRKYIQFARIDGNEEQLRLVYERAIIPNAQNEEFWLSYARYLIASGKINEASTVYARACVVLPIGRLKLRHHYARFLESQGEAEFAKEFLLGILVVLPSSVETILILAGLVLRHEGFETAQALLEQHISQLENDEVKAFLVSEISEIVKTFLSIEEARSLFKRYETDLQDSFIFWREFLRFEIAARNPDWVKAVFDQIKTSPLHARQIKDLGHYYMDFALTQGNDGVTSTNQFFDIEAQVHPTAALTL